MQYRRNNQPGCGGCILILLLFSLITGGFSGLFHFMGTIFTMSIAGILIFLIFSWGFSYWVRNKIATYEVSQTENQNQFVRLVAHILINIAKIDGTVSKEEITTIHNFFQYNLGYNHEKMNWVKSLIKEAVSLTQPLESLLEEFRSSFIYEQRLILLELIYQTLYAKQNVTDMELQMARDIAAYLQIMDYDKRTLEVKYKYGNQKKTTGPKHVAERHYAALGLEPGANKATIKKAYRQLCMKYHPDRVQQLGEEFQELAETKMKEINTAYDFFKKL